MSGFPSRIVRSILGPLFRDAAPVENPETDIGARQFNAAFHQVAGMNLVAARAALIATYSGGAFQIAHRAEAWNPENDQAHPTPARAAAGNYSYTFASTYKDEEGSDVSTVLLAARVSCIRDLSAGFASRIEAHAWVEAANPLVVQVRLWDAVGAGVDHPFWLEVF